MGLHTRLRNKKFNDVVTYLIKKGLILRRTRGDHHTFINPANKRTYQINPLKKTKNAVPEQLISMLKTLELPDDFWDNL